MSTVALKTSLMIGEKKMRLIDADELGERLLTRWKTADKNAEKEIQRLMSDVVTPICVGMPTVDAIPIEWIEDIYIKYMKTLKANDNSPMLKKWFELRIHAYRMLIRDWRKENESNSNM